MERCPICKEGKLKAGKAKESRTVASINFTGQVPAQVCTKCGEEFVQAADLGRFEVAIAERLASLGVRQGEAFKFMRKVLGLRAVNLAELLDVTPETVSRWETGEPEARAFALLGGIVAERMQGQTATADRLKALRGPRKPPARVQVDAA